MFKLTALLPSLRATLATAPKERQLIQRLLKTGWQETIASSDYSHSHTECVNAHPSC